MVPIPDRLSHGLTTHGPKCANAAFPPIEADRPIHTDPQRLA